MKQRSIPHTKVSGYPISVTDHLDAEQVIDYKVYGNSVQDGTPTPETPIEIQYMADYKVILNANGYYEKGVLTEEDLSELQQMINAKNSLEECTEDDTTINVGYEVRNNEILKG